MKLLLLCFTLSVYFYRMLPNAYEWFHSSKMCVLCQLCLCLCHWALAPDYCHLAVTSLTDWSKVRHLPIGQCQLKLFMQVLSSNSLSLINSRCATHEAKVKQINQENKTTLLRNARRLLTQKDQQFLVVFFVKVNTHYSCSNKFSLRCRYLLNYTHFPCLDMNTFIICNSKPPPLGTI